MRQETWDLLEKQFSRFPIMRSEAVPKEEFDSAISQSGLEVRDNDFRDFVLRYGGAIVGAFPIYGLRRAEPMGAEEGSFIEITRQFQRDGWVGVDGWIVISMDHAGNPIGIAEDGSVWCSDHDAGKILPMASSFEDYLRGRCLKV